MKKISLFACILSGIGMNIAPVFAEGGISIHATRIIYPLSAMQNSVSVVNSSDADSYLVQSWVEDPNGHKSQDFIVTPPLYVSGPHNENTLRIMLMRDSLPNNKETLYYFVVKAIPGENDNSGKKTSAQVLKVAAASRIKLFVRPEELPTPNDKTISQLTFHSQGSRMEISNPTPYYFTLTQISAGSERERDIMVAPDSSASEPVTKNSSGRINFHILNDFGAISKSYNAPLSPQI